MVKLSYKANIMCCLQQHQLTKEDFTMLKTNKIADFQEKVDFEEDVVSAITENLKDISHLQTMLDQSLEEGESDYRVRLLESHMSVLINQNWLIIDQLAKLNKKLEDK